MKWPRILAVAGIVGAFAVCTYFYLVHWDIAFSSDTALISLMGKYIAFQGERPLFVWSVGYQGLLIEGYLIALMYKWFGVSPITGSIAPTLVLWLAVSVWSVAVKRAFGWPIALLTAVLTTVSTPLFFYLNMRTLPNFPEAFLIGSCLVLLYGDFVEGVKSRIWLTLGMGFLVGFGLYIFPIAEYFTLAVVAHLFLVYVREQYEKRGRSFFSDFVLPYRQFVRRIPKILVQVLTGFAAFCAVWALVVFIFPALNFRSGKHSFPGDPLVVLFATFAYLLLINGLFYFRSAPGREKILLLPIIFGVFVGYSPALYDKLILGGHSIKRIGITGGWQAVANRLDYLGYSLRLILNVDSLPRVGVLAASLATLAILYFIFCQLTTHFRYLRAGAAAPDFHRQSPFFFLPLLILAIFLTASMVVDRGSSRYLVYLVPAFAVAIAWSVCDLWRKLHNSLIRGLLCGVFVLLVINNAFALRKDILRSDSGESFATLIRALDRHQVRYAYADYWFAYAITFLTNERIILEPITSNYCPHYGPLVRKQKRVGLLLNRSESLKQNEVVVAQIRYRVKERILLDHAVDLFILERIS